MNRRTFIAVLGGTAAAAWPLAARAQQGERMRRIGVLMAGQPGIIAVRVTCSGLFFCMARQTRRGLKREPRRGTSRGKETLPEYRYFMTFKLSAARTN